MHWKHTLRTRSRHFANQRSGLNTCCQSHNLAWALLSVFATVSVPSPAQARLGSRPLFEPTDLQLEDPGVVDFDFQMGAIRGRDPWRVVVPDFELNFGFLRNVELDLDGSYALEGSNESPFAQPHAAPDALWPSVKVGVRDWYDAEASRAWAVGVQVGPKLPIAQGSRGVGVEGLLLLGLLVQNTHFVLNAGALADPRPAPGDSRPLGFECGLDIHTPLDKDDTYAFIGELAAVHFFSSDPHQLLSTAGLSYSPFNYLDLSVIALVGWLNGSDRYGILLGVTPRLRWLRA
jgi:hypothetical protein